MEQSVTPNISLSGGSGSGFAQSADVENKRFDLESQARNNNDDDDAEESN
jgi:hypothetical protein